MRDTSYVDPNNCGKRSARGADRAIATVAQRQHGVVARRQLIRLGLESHAIDYRLQTRRLHLLHRGVYAVGHLVLSGEARWMAAVLAGGAGAVLSHRSAAALWGIHSDSRSWIDVTAPPARRGQGGIRFHRGRLACDEVTIERGIPVTTVARTVLDLAAVVGRRQVERALNEAEVLRLAERLSLDALLARHPGRNGTRSIRAILSEGRIGQGFTRGELENRFLTFLEDAGLPRPETNFWLEPAPGRSIEADCVWRTRRLVVELDGHAAHGTRVSYERDRERDRMMQAAGWRVVRITWRQLHDAPLALAADLRAMLGT